MMAMANLRMGQGQGPQCTIIDPGQEKFIKRFMGHVKRIALIITCSAECGHESETCRRKILRVPIIMNLYVLPGCHKLIVEKN